MRQLSPADAMYVFGERPLRNSNHIGGVQIFDPSTAPEPITFEKVLELFRRRLPLARSFRERLVRVPLDLDYPFWIRDKHFDLEYHVRHTALPRPGTRQQFFALADRLLSYQLDLSRPPWEAYFIEGIDAMDGIPPGSFGLLTKFHHAAIDGVSGMEMITAIMAPDDAADKRISQRKWRGEDEPSQVSLLMRALGANATSPWRMGRAFVRALPRLAEGRQRVRQGEVARPKSPKVPKTRFNQPVTPHKVLEGRNFPFTEFKRLKDAVPGTTINDVVLAIVGGSMRRYLEAKNDLPKDSLVAMVPISTRTEEHAGTQGNQVTARMVKLHTEIAAPLERLAAVAAAMREIKDYNQAVGARTLADTTAAMPGMLLGLAYRAMSQAGGLMEGVRVANTLVSNTSGPLTPVYFMGARCVGGYGAGPSVDGMGLVHLITTFSGIIVISFSACRELLPDPEFYADCLERSFDELSAAIAARDGSAPKQRRRK